MIPLIIASVIKSKKEKAKLKKAKAKARAAIRALFFVTTFLIVAFTAGLLFVSIGKSNLLLSIVIAAIIGLMSGAFADGVGGLIKVILICGFSAAITVVSTMLQMNDLAYPITALIACFVPAVLIYFYGEYKAQYPSLIPILTVAGDYFVCKIRA